MKKLMLMIVMMCLSSLGWGASYSGSIKSVEVKWNGAINIYRYYLTLQGSSKGFYLEAKDGRSEAVVNAQYSMILTAYTMGQDVTFVTDYDISNEGRIRDIKIVQ